MYRTYDYNYNFMCAARCKVLGKRAKRTLLEAHSVKSALTAPPTKTKNPFLK